MSVDPTTPLAEDFLYTSIPQLGPRNPAAPDEHPSLLPHLGGLPGITYYQCPVACLRESQNDGWGPVVNTKTYTIRGPLGQIDCQLLARGNPIPGSDAIANRREFLIHPDICAQTGLSPEHGNEMTDTELTAFVASQEKTAEGPEKPAKVQPKVAPTTKK